MFPLNLLQRLRSMVRGPVKQAVVKPRRNYLLYIALPLCYRCQTTMMEGPP